MLERTRKEDGITTVKLTGKKNGLEGIPVAELSADQKELVRKVLIDLMKPFRRADADEAMKLIAKNGFDTLHMAFSKANGISNDGVWDNRQIEGPAIIWSFRGSPHVNGCAHIHDKAESWEDPSVSPPGVRRD